MSDSIKVVKAKFSDSNVNLFSEDAQLLSQIGLTYDQCSDCILSSDVCEKVYEALYGILKKDIDDADESCSIVLNNTSNGQMILSRPINSILYIFNSDEYAHNIASVQSSVSKANKYNEFYRVDISAVFGGVVNSNFNANAVICQGFCRHLIYQEVDSEMFFRNLDCHEYFTLRASYLVRSGGVVVSVIPETKEEKIKNLCSLYGMDVVLSMSYGDVKILFFQKQ
jgi:hypothetical protein